MPQHQILISACLLGDLVRYDRKSKYVENPIILAWQKTDRLVKICPEVSGGLSTPRLPAEIQPSNSSRIKVVNVEKEDVTDAFESGARYALQKCLDNNIKLAILTEGSPSCGSSTINDGLFKHKKIPGEGITTRLLRKNGIAVFSHLEIKQARDYFKQYIMFEETDNN